MILASPRSPGGGGPRLASGELGRLRPAQVCVNPLRWWALGGETWNVMPDVVVRVGSSMSPEKYQSNPVVR